MRQALKSLNGWIRLATPKRAIWMPRKQTVLTEAERSKRIREAARDAEANAKEFERAFKRVVPSRKNEKPSS